MMRWPTVLPTELETSEYIINSPFWFKIARALQNQEFEHVIKIDLQRLIVAL